MVTGELPTHLATRVAILPVVPCHVNFDVKVAL